MRIPRLLIAALVLAWPGELTAQWVTTDEQAYRQASHNWAFRRLHPEADRLFNGFDFGHAILYETLLRQPDAPTSLLERDTYLRLTEQLLRAPPRLPLEEAAIEVHYARLVPEVKLMFDWAHLLHRQVYDILVDPELDEPARDREVARQLAWYQSRPDLAFSTRPKGMALMEGHAFSLAFRERYPRFNGLIWAYHWLQVGLYDAVLAAGNREEEDARVRATVGRFWQMVEAGGDGYPHVMPMTAAVAPRFAARYPEVAIVFDNLHSMHDVVSDLLATGGLDRRELRAELLRAAAQYRDDSTEVISRDEWLAMARAMGVQNQGGPATDFSPELPTPTVRRGAPHHEVMGH